MQTGKVIWFVPTVGLGFIRPDDGSREILIHMADVTAAGLATLEIDQRISYDEMKDGSKRWAANLKVV